MAALPAPPSLQLSTTAAASTLFPSSPRVSFPSKHRRHASPFRATADENSESSTEPESAPPSSDSSSDPFDSRISNFRLRYRAGTGKKAEMRKARKQAASSSSSSSGASLYLPPVPLKQPVSGGLKVEFGFTPYSERLNGRIAFLGLAALLLVELATGKSVLNYHTPSIVLIQIYFVAAVSAVYMKYEKEKISVWPESSSSSPAKE
ncbi:unnamed protein product [Linum tenue]|uniref:Uncharacterized protein n=1 Tax=Linum tenue TaxID=586396 RepID=A0AAV0MAX2_9ROSI|nr:unnamed protein product [Linum tenue]